MRDRIKELIYILRHDGEGCECYAYYRGECCCEAKWTESYHEEIADILEKLYKNGDIK